MISSRDLHAEEHRAWIGMDCLGLVFVEVELERDGDGATKSWMRFAGQRRGTIAAPHGL